MNAKIESWIKGRLAFGSFANKRTGDGRVVIETEVGVDKMVVEDALVECVAGRKDGISVI